MHPSIVFENCVPFICLAVLVLPNFNAESHNVPFADESFRRLESGENSEEIVNQCCRRETKFVTIGYTLDDTELRVDVGQCRQACEKPQIKPLRREEFDKYLKKYPNMDPMQIFLALQTRVTNPQGSSIEQDDQEMSHSSSQLSMPMSTSSSSSYSCLSSTCHPVSYRRERHFGMGGQEQEIDVIESCDCIKMPQECQRLSRPVRLHIDTPYEKVLDVGQCLGSCDDTSDHSSDLTCNSIRNRTVTVEGPNGAQCMEVIDECQCTGNCYRIREFFKVYDYSNVFRALDERATNHSVTEGRNETIGNEVGVLLKEPGLPLPIDTSESVTIEPLTKVIDIGRCGGSCSDSHVTSKCLAWSSLNNGTCISSLYGGRSKCSPTKFVTHSYTDKKGHRHNVVSVITCGCR